MTTEKKKEGLYMTTEELAASNTVFAMYLFVPVSQYRMKKKNMKMIVFLLSKFILPFF